MAKFVFKFQSVLDLKMQIEDSLKNELGKAVRKLEHEKELLWRLEAEREGYINEFNTMSSKGMLVDKLREYNSYISYLKERMEIQKENVKYARNNVDKYREQLIKAVQEREMFDKLKEKKFDEYMKEQMKHEQRLNDEIVSFNYNRSTGDGNG